MDGPLVEALLREVRRQLEARRPGALLVGRAPEARLPWRWAGPGEPWAAVVLGSMDAEALLGFPDPLCLQALLEGKSLWLWPPGEDWRQYRHTAGRALWAELLRARSRMRQLGVRLLPPSGRPLLTAREVQAGLLPPGREAPLPMTPLARELWEELP